MRLALPEEVSVLRFWPVCVWSVWMALVVGAGALALEPEAPGAGVETPPVAAEPARGEGTEGTAEEGAPPHEGREPEETEPVEPSPDGDPEGAGLRSCHARVSQSMSERCKEFEAEVQCAERCNSWCSAYQDDHAGAACSCFPGSKPAGCRAAEANP